MLSRVAPHLPQRAPIDAYGNGGFRFADMSHKGSLIVVPSGMYAWTHRDGHALDPEDFSQVWQEAADIEFVLLGTGQAQVWPSAALSKAFTKAGLGLDVMQTGAAVRTYNVLLAEKRAVAAAFVAVESHR